MNVQIIALGQVFQRLTTLCGIQKTGKRYEAYYYYDTLFVEVVHGDLVRIKDTKRICSFFTR